METLGKPRKMMGKLGKTQENDGENLGKPRKMMGTLGKTEENDGKTWE